MRATFRRTGKWLADIRTSRQMTQVQLAKRLGMHAQAISNTERGLNMPPKAKLRRLVQALKISKIEREHIALAIEVDAMEIIREEFRELI